MRNILVLAIYLFAFSAYGQPEDFDEDDTLDMYTEYHLVNYKDWSETIFEPTEENIEWDKLTKVMYNPIVNYDVLDSVLRWRILEGSKPIKIDWGLIDKKIINNMSWICMDISKADSDKVTLGRFEDAYPDCDCVNDLVNIILDDSTIYIDGKKDVTFKKYLLSNRVKRIEVYYYQVSRRDDPNEKEEHLIVNIRKRFSLYTKPYYIF
jgi:hypothetical protein